MLSGISMFILYYGRKVAQISAVISVAQAAWQELLACGITDGLTLDPSN